MKTETTKLLFELQINLMLVVEQFLNSKNKKILRERLKDIMKSIDKAKEELQ